jgi:Skp family chaperone for outer membrane proteins
MKNFNFLILILIFATVSFAQTEENQIATNVKVAVIYSDKFADEKVGIDEFIEAKKTLEAEFKPEELELKASFEKVDKLRKEITQLSKAYEVSVGLVEKKINEYKLANCEFRSRTEQIRNVFNKRESEIYTEVNDKISTALKQFAFQKGYEIILDGSKSNDFTVLSGDYHDITSEFIDFYNNLK